MSVLKLPPSYRDRLAAVGKSHGFASPAAFGLHLVGRGLRACGAQDKVPAERELARITDERGYSSPAELIEHLLELGLRAYEEPAHSPEELEKRLRGLGYID